MRWCERCETRRLADCSILCFAEKTHDDPARPIHTTATDQEPHGT